MPHRIDQLVHDMKRMTLTMFVLFFAAVIGLASLYTQVRDLGHQNQARIRDVARLVHAIDEQRHAALLQANAALASSCARDQQTYAYIREATLRGIALDQRLLRDGHSGISASVLRDAITLQRDTLHRFAPLSCATQQIGAR